MTPDRTRPAAVLGKNISEARGGVTPIVTPLDPQLSQGQLDWLALNPDQTVGECVFTSWHHDIDTPPSGSEMVAGHALDAPSAEPDFPLFRMSVSINSNDAARALVSDCLKAGDPALEDDFTRGCMMCGKEQCEPYRKSDPSVCTMAMRVAECGCEVSVKQPDGAARPLDLAAEADLEHLQELFVPRGRRGFTLGTWEGIGTLPAGCRYVKMGDPTRLTMGGVEVEDPNADQTLVACDLKGSHIVATEKDPKEACRTAYGEEIVVHVRAPFAEVASLTCDTTIAGCEGVPWEIIRP